VGGDLQKNVEKVLNRLDRIILGIKAKGGYKYREYFKLSDHELDLFLANCEKQIRIMAISLVIAEAMLREPPPSIHPRWEEYLKRRAAIVAEMAKK